MHHTSADDEIMQCSIIGPTVLYWTPQTRQSCS